ncbi:hypothetical protein AAF712_010828 [Marasmius tenuissimus]|uniref:Uncharacterized protein n=1 Tax=Marasmius tenuissimus TaxID=585030 RepID=A0ABR2ZMC7_9AGAR
MFSLHIVVVAAVLLHQATAMVIPEGSLNELERRAINCPGGGKSPCVCGGQLGIKVSENKCPDGKFVFSDPKSLNSGDMKKVAGGRTAGLQCDHLVEAQFVAKEFVNGSPMCNHFLNGATGTADFAAFKRVLNTAQGGNFVFLDTTVNNAKGKFIAGKSFNGAKKIALGVASYLTKTRSDAKSAAQALKAEMDRIATANNFQSFSANFANDYDALIGTTITVATTRAAALKAVAPPPPKQPAQTVGKKRPASGAAGGSPAKKAKTTAKKTTTKKTTTKKTTTPGKATSAQKVAAARKKAAAKKTVAGKKKN